MKVCIRRPSFMVELFQNDALVHEAPAIVGCQMPTARAHTARRVSEGQ